MDTPKHEGLKVSLAGKEYILPPLNLKQVRTVLIPSLEAMSTSDGKYDVMVEGYSRIIFASLSRNYPDISFEEFEDMMDDFSIVQPLGDQIIMRSGFSKRVQASGGAPASADPSTGNSSTATSSPPQAGAGST